MPAASEIPANKKPPKSLVSGLLRLMKGMTWMALWIGACFGGAGRLDWTRGWMSAIVYFAGISISGAVLQRVNPNLIEEREKWRRPDLAWFDKVFLSIFLPLTFVQTLVAGLDAARFHWLPLPAWMAAPGIVLFLAAMALVTWTLAMNQFAETTVRIQSERGHTVVATGPYRFVRHPIYVGMILMYTATALMLGSGWAMAVGALMAALIIWRTAKEDRFLHRKLPGYPEYAAQTRFRLIPGMW